MEKITTLEAALQRIEVLQKEIAELQIELVCYKYRKPSGRQ